MDGSVVYTGGLGVADTGRMPSLALWQNCPESLIKNNIEDGFVYWEDFVEGRWTQAANVAASATTLTRGVGFTGATAGSSIGAIATNPTGVIELANTTDGECTTLQLLGDANTAGKIIFSSGKKLWAEARVKVLNITTNEHGMFCGFGEEALAATVVVITAADAMADKDLVGFHYTAAATTAIGTYHNTASGGGISTIDATAGTLAADTWTKLGMYCDGTTLYFYQDGVLLDESVLLSATNFPNDEEMAFYLTLGVGSGGGDCKVSCDWVKIAQTR